MDETVQLAKAVDRRVVNACPACGAKFCIGTLGKGTLIEVFCKRRGCKHHMNKHSAMNQPFYIVVG